MTLTCLLRCETGPFARKLFQRYRGQGGRIAEAMDGARLRAAAYSDANAS